MNRWLAALGSVAIVATAVTVGSLVAPAVVPQDEVAKVATRTTMLCPAFESATATRTVAAASTVAEFPGLQIEVRVEEQYRNMAEGLAREPRAVAYAEEALERLGRSPRRTIVRGGTDGSRLTELGLPTPNLATGEHMPHSPLEWASLDEMRAAVEWLVALAARWAAEGTGK